MNALVRNSITFICFGAIFISILIVFLILTAYLMQHSATGDVYRWVLMILFSVALLIIGICLLIYCSKIKKSKILMRGAHPVSLFFYVLNIMNGAEPDLTYSE